MKKLSKSQKSPFKEKSLTKNLSYIFCNNKYIDKELKYIPWKKICSQSMISSNVNIV